MIEVTIANVIAFLIALFGCLKGIRNPLLLPCLLLACFYSLRLDYTMDYGAYEKMFYYTNIFENMNYSRGVRDVEIGWKILNRICRPFGYQFLVALVTFIQIGTFGWFAQKYIPKKWQWLIFFFYVFNPSNLMLGLSALRQTVSISIMMWAMPYILKRKLWPAFLLWLLGYSFHKSCLIAFPLIFVGCLSPRYWKTVGIAEITMIVLSMFVPVMVLEITASALPILNAENYYYYLQVQKGQELETGLGLTFRVAFIGYMIYHLKKQNKLTFIFITIFGLSIVFQILGLVGVYFTRLAYYYTIIGLPSYIIFVNRWRSSLLDRVLIVCYALLQIITYFRFFVGYFPEGYLYYKTILDL